MKTLPRFVWLAELLLTLGLGQSGITACKERADPARAKPAASASATPPDAPTPVAVPVPAASLGIVWETPAALAPVGPVSPVRKASYRPPRAGGDTEDADLGVFYFGSGQGGDTEANAERWVRQFPDATPASIRRADRQVNGLRQHVVEVPQGTFSSQMQGAAASDKPNSALLGAIVEAPDGRYFFKMTGPRATVQQARPLFFALLDSIRPR